MNNQHQYNLNVQWTGNTGSGTSAYRDYDRGHIITGEDKPPIFGSSSPAFLGDSAFYNPEELLLASLSSCHMLWYLHLCADHKIIVESYEDHPIGTMSENENGSGQMVSVTLQPQVLIRDAEMLETALKLHEEAHKMCFIARSVNFPVGHLAVIDAKPAPSESENPDFMDFSVRKLIPKMPLW